VSPQSFNRRGASPRRDMVEAASWPQIGQRLDLAVKLPAEVKASAGNFTFESLAIPDLKLVRARKFGDARGYFRETYSALAFAEAGLVLNFVQDNHSLSAEQGTVRGLHYQAAPYAQAKLVRVTRGAILDVAVDIRHGSPSFGQHVAVRLDATDGAQLFIPVGFAHGFCTLEPDTELAYKVTAPYAPAHDHGIAWNDPELAIDWPVDAATATLSDKDRRHPTLREAPACFAFDMTDKIDTGGIS
jgi:dTDP-4-dehydrorhamnose 3,5-epimerase